MLLESEYGEFSSYNPEVHLTRADSLPELDL